MEEYAVEISLDQRESNIKSPRVEHAAPVL
jgi:hypothetical protein